MASDHYSSEKGAPVSLVWRAIGKVCKLNSNLVLRDDGSINRSLADFVELKKAASTKPVLGISTRDIVIDAHSGVWVRLFLPASTPNNQANPSRESKMPIVFFFHGGGFALLRANHSLYDSFCRRVCRELQVVVVSVDYRRSPEYRYPTAYEDCFSALKWVRTEGNNHLPASADPSRCFLMGDSAGGNIVHHVGCMAAGEELDPVRVVGHIAMFPSFGGMERTESELRLADAPLSCLSHRDWFWRAFLPEGENRNHPAANVDASALKSVALPASMVLVAEHDGLKDRQIRYVKGLQSAGKEVRLVYYKGGFHCFQLFASFYLSPTLLSDIRAFVEEYSAAHN